MNILKTNSYSVSVAQICGVKSAVFLSYLWNTAKEDFSDITMERNDIFNSVGLTEDEQIDVEKSLSQSGVITVTQYKGNPSKNHYAFHGDVFNSLMSSQNFMEPLDVSTVAPKKELPRKNSRQKFANSLKAGLLGSTSPIVHQYLCDWIDAIYANPKYCLSHQGVNLCVNDLINFSDNDDVRIAIIKIAIKRGWRDLNWAINDYKENVSKDKGLWGGHSQIKAERISTENGEF